MEPVPAAAGIAAEIKLWVPRQVLRRLVYDLLRRVRNHADEPSRATPLSWTRMGMVVLSNLDADK